MRGEVLFFALAMPGIALLVWLVRRGQLSAGSALRAAVAGFLLSGKLVVLVLNWPELHSAGDLATLLFRALPFAFLPAALGVTIAALVAWGVTRTRRITAT